MNKKYFQIWIASLLSAIVCVFEISAQKRQTTFNAEESVSQNVALPAAVMAVLKSEPRVDVCFKAKDAGADENQWFETSGQDQ